MKLGNLEEVSRLSKELQVARVEFEILNDSPIDISVVVTPKKLPDKWERRVMDYGDKSASAGFYVAVLDNCKALVSIRMSELESKLRTLGVDVEP